MTQKQNIQDAFLNQARREKVMVTIFLVNGFQFKGFVRCFDSFTVVLDVEGRQRLVYKHAISTVVPDKSLDFSEDED